MKILEMLQHDMVAGGSDLTDAKFMPPWRSEVYRVKIYPRPVLPLPPDIPRLRAPMYPPPTLPSAVP